MTNLQTNTEDIKIHIAILGDREFYCVVAKNHKTGHTVPEWLKKREIVSFVERMNARFYQVWISLHDKELNNDSTEGVRALNDLFFDIDADRKSKDVPATTEELIACFKKAQRLKDYLEKEYGARGFIGYSGNGWHPHFPLPRYDLPDKKTRLEVDKKLKIFCKNVSEKTGIKIDKTYDLRRMTAVIGSINLKLPNHPIPTAWYREEQETFDIEKAREQNKKLLEAIINATQIEDQWFDIDVPKGKGYRGRHPECIKKLVASGVAEGQRNDVAMRVLGYFQNFRHVSDNRVWIVAKEWNQKNKPPFTDEELSKKIEEVKRGGYSYGCDDPILKSVCTNKKRCPIWKSRSKGIQIEFTSRTPIEMVAGALQESQSIILHPIIDFNKEIGYTIGCFLNEENLLQIIDKKVEILCIDDNPVELQSSIRLSVKPTSIKAISKRCKESLLNIAGDIISGKEIENKARNEVGISVLDRIEYYFFHSDKRWFLFASCFIIATYYHRLFLVFPHWDLQGQRETGKTTMGMLLHQLCWNPTPLSSNLNPAPIFRRCEDVRCTHLADLTRVSYKNNDLIDIYEAIEPDFAVSRCVGPEKDRVKDFFPFSPKALMVRRNLPFGAKAIECITEKSPKGSPYTKRRREIPIDPNMKGIVESILRSVICNWKDVYEAYKEMKQDDKLFGRRFELWQPFLAVCRAYFPDRYNELLNLAYEDAEKSEMGDFTSEVEDALIGYLLIYAEEGKKSRVFAQKELTEELKNILGDRVVKSYHIVKSALKNLKICRKRTGTTQGVKVQIDLEKVLKLAKEKKIEKLEETEESKEFCDKCGYPIEGKVHQCIIPAPPKSSVDSSMHTYSEIHSSALKSEDKDVQKPEITKKNAEKKESGVSCIDKEVEKVEPPSQKEVIKVPRTPECPKCDHLLFDGHKCVTVKNVCQTCERSEGCDGNLEKRKKCYKTQDRIMKVADLDHRDIEFRCSAHCPKAFEEKKECVSRPDYMEFRKQCYKEEMERKRRERELQSKRTEELYEQMMKRQYEQKAERKLVKTSDSDKEKDSERDDRIRQFLKEGFEFKEEA